MKAFGKAFGWATLAMFLNGCENTYQPTDEEWKRIHPYILNKVPKIPYEVNAKLGDKAIYLGLDVTPKTIQPGETFTLHHYWQVHGSLDGWQVFVHLNSPNREKFINADHPPVFGLYPADRWKKGEIVHDQHEVSLPPDWSFSEALVYTGLYAGEQRMTVIGPQDEEGRIIAGTIPVKAHKPTPRKELIAKMVRKTMVIDGRLDEKDWQEATASTPFVDSFNGAAVPFKTTTRACWDRKFLYLAFENQDRDIFGDMKKRDDPLWTQEAVEVFIDANADSKDYVEFQFNPLGTVFDSYLPEYRKNQNDFNSQILVAVRVDGTLDNRNDQDKGWTVEVAIPWRDTTGRKKTTRLPPQPGDQWRINFFRTELVKNEPQRASAWSPPMIGDFHALDKFGKLVFADTKGNIPSTGSDENRSAASP